MQLLFPLCRWREYVPEDIFSILLYAEKPENLKKLHSLPCPLWIQAACHQLSDGQLQRSLLWVIAQLPEPTVRMGCASNVFCA